MQGDLEDTQNRLEELIQQVQGQAAENSFYGTNQEGAKEQASSNHAIQYS
jgi:hypothetical protein